MSYYILNSSLNPINQDQCIGDTLDTFNANFSALDTAGFSLSTALIRLSAQVNNIQDDDSSYLTTANASTTYVTKTSPSVADAWVNFDGTQTSPISPKRNYNVSSITKNSAGEYTINFTTALPTSSYAVVAMCESESNTPTVVQLNPSYLPTVNGFRLTIAGGSNYINSQIRGDYSFISAIVFC
jgi:hypothetical protein